MLIQTEIQTEFLATGEVVELTGAEKPAGQMKWLKNHDWNFVLNAKNKVKIGRWYARMKLAGVNLEAPPQQSTDLPKFDKVS